MNTIRTIILMLVASLSASAQDQQTKDAWATLQHNFSSLSNIDIKYTSTRSDSIRNQVIVYSDELKVRDNLFWFSEQAANQSDPKKNFSRLIAYDGKRYQALDDLRACIIESKPNLTNIQSLAGTPPIRVLHFIHIPDAHSFNSFQFLRNPDNWRKAASSVFDVILDASNGGGILQMTVKNENGNYQIKLRPDLNCFPIYTHTVNGVGFPVTIECSSFQKYAINGASFFFPTEITDILNRPDGSVAVETKTAISSITPLSSAKSDNSDFQIDPASTASVFDADTHKYIKVR